LLPRCHSHDASQELELLGGADGAASCGASRRVLDKVQFVPLERRKGHHQGCKNEISQGEERTLQWVNTSPPPIASDMPVPVPGQLDSASTQPVSMHASGPGPSVGYGGFPANSYGTPTGSPDQRWYVSDLSHLPPPPTVSPPLGPAPRPLDPVSTDAYHTSPVPNVLQSTTSTPYHGVQSTPGGRVSPVTPGTAGSRGTDKKRRKKKKDKCAQM